MIEKMKRRRRFFEDHFKRELVKKFQAKQLNYSEIEKQFEVPRVLFKVWVKRAEKEASAKTLPTFRAPLNAVVPIDMRLSQLIDALVEERIKAIVQQKMNMLQGPESMRTIQATLK